MSGRNPASLRSLSSVSTPAASRPSSGRSAAPASDRCRSRSSSARSTPTSTSGSGGATLRKRSPRGNFATFSTAWPVARRAPTCWRCTVSRLAGMDFATRSALLPHQSSVDHSMRLTIEGPGEETIRTILSAATRSRLRGKQRKLQALPGYRYFRADTPAEIDRLLDAFLAVKSIHMAATRPDERVRQRGRGRVHARAHATNGFPTAGMLIDTSRARSRRRDAGDVRVPRSTSYRCSSMFNTYTLGENSRHSPGLILLVTW